MAVFSSSTSPYTYQYQPASDESSRLYLENQLRSIARSTLSHTNAIQELQQGVSSGSKVNLGLTGVQAGTYALATVRVGADGRVYAISAGKAPSSLPETSIAGQVLTSTATGAAWADPKTLGGSALPSGGSVGQVLTRLQSGSAWADAPAAHGVTSVALASTRDLKITGSPVTASGTIGLDLAPTGVTAGTYTLASIVVDAGGRITAAYSGQLDDPKPFGFSSTASTSLHRFWRLHVPGALGSPALAVAAIGFSDAIGGADLGGAASADASNIVRAYASPQAVNAIVITAGDPDAAPLYGTVQYSDDGGLWTTAWEIPPQGVWTGGETRTFSLVPQADGRGTINRDTPVPYLTMLDQGTGGEIRVSVVNGAWSFTQTNGVENEDGSGAIQSENGSGAISTE